MALPESALLLGGFVLAHAAWSISDAPDLLVPLAIVERNSQRNLVRFEAGTQQEAIANGKNHMAAIKDADAWAFAREGLLNENGKKIDVISVDIWAKGSKEQITLIQRFEPYSLRKHYRLIGEADVSVDGVMLEKVKAKALVETVRKGIAQHSKVASLWEVWQKP